MRPHTYRADRRYVAGIDAGGSKTVALLADESGRVCAEARGEGANLHLHGETAVARVLRRVIEELAAPAPLDAVCLGIAGVDRPAERRAIAGALRPLGLGSAPRVENDAYIALVAGAPERRGVVIVAGTGSLAYGVDAAGRVERAGGWGYLLGDEGSAYWLGHAALRRAVRAADGRGPATTLGERIAARLGLDLPEGLVAWFYDQHLFRYRIAELAPLVEEAATEGDAEAEQVLDEAAHHLAGAARAVAGRLDFDGPYPLVFSGGAFRACPSLVPRLDACLDLPDARRVHLEAEPATGAVTLALDLLN